MKLHKGNLEHGVGEGGAECFPRQIDTERKMGPHVAYCLHQVAPPSGDTERRPGVCCHLRWQLPNRPSYKTLAAQWSVNLLPGACRVQPPQDAYQQTPYLWQITNAALTSGAGLEAPHEEYLECLARTATALAAWHTSAFPWWQSTAPGLPGPVYFAAGGPWAAAAHTASGLPTAQPAAATGRC